MISASSLKRNKTMMLTWKAIVTTKHQVFQGREQMAGRAVSTFCKDTQRFRELVVDLRDASAQCVLA
jgi:hypothetical protein